MRLLVLWSGACLFVLGILTILSMPLGVAGTLIAVSAWLFTCGRELRALISGYRRCRLMSLNACGEIELMQPDGRWHSARLLAGSVLLRRIAWIRVVDSRGCRFAELLRGRCRDDHDWRRLHIIWRHIGAIPGSC